MAGGLHTARFATTMKILALNCGSSTVKYQLFHTSPELIRRNEDRVLARGSVERIGTPPSQVKLVLGDGMTVSYETEVASHRDAVNIALECLTDPDNGVIRSVREIDGVGHRVVHAGEYYAESAVIDAEVERRIEECCELAPLHNPHNLSGYRAVRAALPESTHVAVFDTAFHQTVPRHAYLFGLPYELYEKHRIRRYGFHGTSYAYITQRFAAVRGGSPADYKLIVCHLGSGSSACAVDRGRSVETSMGFTPLDGLMMGTRPGLLDPGVVLHLMARQGLGVAEVSEMLNNRSGLLGISGSSNDMRTLVAAAEAGDERAALAIEVFCYRVKKYIGTLYAVLNGADAVVFTGGIGEHQPFVRQRCCRSLDALGIAIDPERNEEALGREMRISPDGAKTEVWVIPTNEELLIARETVRLIAGRS